MLDKLAKLGHATGQAQGRVRLLETAGHQDMLVAILREIDETILGRLLTFESHDGQTVGMEVANRRILRFIQLPSDVEGALIDQPLEGADGPEAGAFHRTLVALLKDFGPLQVRSTKMSRATDPSEIGCSADALALAWELGPLYGAVEPVHASAPALEPEPTPSPEPEPAPEPDEFAAFCQSRAIAWVVFRGSECCGQSGPDDMVAIATEIAGQKLAKLDKAFAGVGALGQKPRCMIFGSGAEAAPSVVYIDGATERTVLLIPEQNLGAISKRWHSS